MEISKRDIRRIAALILDLIVAVLLGVAPAFRLTEAIASQLGSYATQGVGILTYSNLVRAMIEAGGSVTDLVSDDELGQVVLALMVLVTITILLCLAAALLLGLKRGKILQFVANGFAIVSVGAIIFIVEMVNRLVREEAGIGNVSLLGVGWGYWIVLVLAITGIVLGVLNLRGSAGRMGSERIRMERRPSASGKIFRCPKCGAEYKKIPKAGACLRCGWHPGSGSEASSTAERRPKRIFRCPKCGAEYEKVPAGGACLRCGWRPNSETTSKKTPMSKPDPVSEGTSAADSKFARKEENGKETEGRLIIHMAHTSGNAETEAEFFHPDEEDDL